MRTRLTNILTTVVLATSIGLLLTIAVGVLGNRWRIVPVLSGSMEPSISTGSVVIATPKPLSDVRAGDVIIYRIPVGDNRLIVHRVLEVVEPGAQPVVITKGDANSAPDPFRARLNGGVAWKVSAHIDGLGYLAVVAKRPAVRMGSVAVAALAFLSLSLGSIWKNREESELGDGSQALA